jgi:S-adenosylmethionine:tRNA-ribosyltransferase-isomerase (queuine synthetase)
LESLPYLYKFLSKNNIVKNSYFDNITENISIQEVEKFIDSNVIIQDKFISFDTKLYIYPGFDYKIVDKLITNFHLPKSSLLMLVAGFM